MIDADTKLIPSFLVGSRDAGCATEFIQDLAGRLANRVQLTTDGHKMYLSAVEDAFSGEVDYAMLVELYGASPEGDHRYSPAECIGAQKHAVHGCPDEKHVSTSYVERANLTMRMSIRRFTRLINGFSKKLENHTAALGLFFAHYNFCRIHQSLRVTPAMATGVTSTVWSVADLVALLPDVAEGKKRGPYRPGIQSRTLPCPQPLLLHMGTLLKGKEGLLTQTEPLLAGKEWHLVVPGFSFGRRSRSGPRRDGGRPVRRLSLEIRGGGCAVREWGLGVETAPCRAGEAPFVEGGPDERAAASGHGHSGERP